MNHKIKGKINKELLIFLQGLERRLPIVNIGAVGYMIIKKGS